MNEFKDLIGKKIVCFRGIPSISSKKTELVYALFDDGETFLQFDEQDSYDYHDCCSSARSMMVQHNKDLWQKMMNCNGYKDPENLGFCPFS